MGGPLLVGTQFRAQLYFSGGQPVHFQPMGAPASFGEPSNVLPGTWIPAEVSLPLAPGVTVTLQVRVWDANFGETFETAEGGYRGASDPFLFHVDRDFNIPAMENLQAFAVTIPEPSAVAFICLGITGFITVGRRMSLGILRY